MDREWSTFEYPKEGSMKINLKELVGKKIRTLVRFDQIPAATEGVVKEFVDNDHLQGIVVEWSLPDNPQDVLVRVGMLDHMQFIREVEPVLVGAGS